MSSPTLSPDDVKSAALAASQTHRDQAPLRIVIVGHVDHGKSTLVGRLFHDTGSLPDGKLEALQESCKKRGVPFEWAFLMDAFKSERDQNITIDTAQIWFRTKRRPYVIIDAPGHKEFLKNMVTGAAQADAALLLIAADEGVQEQSRRHGYLLSMLGVRQVHVVVNKMDRVGFDPQVFEAIKAEYTAFLTGIGVEPAGFIPVSARDGDNVASLSDRAPWYSGKSVVDVLDSFSAPTAPADAELRFPVQDIYRFDNRRILAGRIEAGTLRVGDVLTFQPGGKTSVVESIETWNAPEKQCARVGESVGITLREQIFVERGHVATRQSEAPAIEGTEVKARVFWMGRQHLEVGRAVKLKLATAEVEARVISIDRLIDASSLDVVTDDKDYIAKDDVAEVTLATRVPIAFDNADRSAATGRFVLVDNYDVAGGGVIFGHAYQTRESVQATEPVQPHERAHRYGHAGAVVWLYGDQAETALAHRLERRLFERGHIVALLHTDGPGAAFEKCHQLGVKARTLADAGVLTIAVTPRLGALQAPYLPGLLPIRIGPHDRAHHEGLLIEPTGDEDATLERIEHFVLTSMRQRAEAARAA